MTDLLIASLCAALLPFYLILGYVVLHAIAMRMTK